MYTAQYYQLCGDKCLDLNALSWNLYSARIDSLNCTTGKHPPHIVYRSTASLLASLTMITGPWNNE